jgi:hypothetical protein
MLQLLILWNKGMKQNKTNLFDCNVTLRRVPIPAVAVQYLYVLKVTTVCLHSGLIYPASTAHAPYHIAISVLSRCTILYCHLCPVTLYHIILPSLSCHAVPYYIAISVLSRCTILYCHLCPVTLYHIILPSLSCHDVPYFPTISHKPHDFLWRNEHKICVLYFLYNLVWNISHYKTKSARHRSECINSSWNIPLIFSDFNETNIHSVYIMDNILYIAPISLILSYLSTNLQVTDTTDQQTSVPSVARSTDCVDIASGCVLPLAQWTWYVHAVFGSGQTGRISGKCSFVISFTACTVFYICYSGDQISDHLRNCQLLQKHSAPCSQFLTAFCQLFLYINCTDGRITKAVCGFHKLIKASKTLHLQPTEFYEYLY